MRHLIPGHYKNPRHIFKMPGSDTMLSNAVVHFGIDAEFDTLILPGRYNYRSIPLWQADKVIAKRAGCSACTVARWRAFWRLMKYRTDTYTRAAA